jgi:transglutaminase-like putative cysteine protease
MSRTTLCLCTAGLLAAGSLLVMALRTRVLGDEIRLPAGPGTWKITMLVQGRTMADAHLWTATPLPAGHQQLVREQATSEELVQKPQEQHVDRRELSWSQAPGVSPGPFRIRYECWYAARTDRAASEHHYAAPKDGEHLRAEPGIDVNNPEITDIARPIAESGRAGRDLAEALHEHVEQQIAAEPTVPGSARGALDCVRRRSGDAAARARLLAALCRNRGLPARLLTGLILADGEEQTPHTWVEIWADGRWLAACPTHHHFGHVPHNYVVFAYGDQKLVRGKNVRGLEQAFLIERVTFTAADAAPPGWGKRLFRFASLTHLPLAEQRLVEILLLLPVCALIICVFRNVIGLNSFGTFTPALIGLAFRDLRSWPGIIVFVAIVLAGWLLRRVLNRFHLLQVPRISLMLSLVISMLVVFVVVSNRLHWPATAYIALFPLIILTGMIERFWTLEEEDGTRASFRTLLTTLAIAGCISLVISRPPVAQHLLRYPETIGLVMAGMLLLGRYTGYRLTELYRFRDFVRQRPADDVPGVVVFSGRAQFGSNRFSSW